MKNFQQFINESSDTDDEIFIQEYFEEMKDNLNEYSFSDEKFGGIYFFYVKNISKNHHLSFMFSAGNDYLDVMIPDKSLIRFDRLKVKILFEEIILMLLKYKPKIISDLNLIEYPYLKNLQGKILNYSYQKEIIDYNSESLYILHSMNLIHPKIQEEYSNLISGLNWGLI